MKFKSIAMRIWFTFTSIILLIVAASLIMYYVVFVFVDSNAKEKDITIVHQTILDGNYSPDVQFDTFQNLRGSEHYVYKDDRLVNYFAYNMAKNSSGKKQPSESKPKRDSGDKFFPHAISSEYLTEIVREYAVSGVNKEVLTKNVNNQKLIIIISEYDGGYLISCVPYAYDNRVLIQLAVLSVILILIGFVVARIVAVYLSKPLKKIEEFTTRVAVKDFSEPITITSIDEFGRLSEAMNKMQDSLRRAEDEERNFLQSISHDLKTPVMVIMSHADAIIDGVYVDSVENTAQIIKDESVALNKKIRELLYLNTLDYVLATQSESEEIDLSRVITSVINRMSLVRDDISFETELNPAVIMADPEKLTTAFENIIDNAIRYAKTCISIKIVTSGGKIHIDIYNDGEPIRLSDTNRVFESLYKDKKGNFGLGLTITKKIINFYNGSIEAVNTEDGVVFKMVF